MTTETSTSASRNWWLDAAAIAGLLFVLLAAGMLIQSVRIFGNPATATGTIYEKYIVPGESEGPPIYNFRYSFRDPSGREHRGLANVTSRIYDSTSTGAPLDIQYQVDDPNNNRVISDTGHPLIVSFVIGGVVGFGLFVYFGLRRWLAFWRGEPDPTVLG